MADFEGLIRQALKTQNSSDPAFRQKIYQSSRAALNRMLEKAGNQHSEAAKVHFKRLEDAISRIEVDYAPAASATPTAETEPAAIAPTAPTLDVRPESPTTFPVEQRTGGGETNPQPAISKPLDTHVRPEPDISDLTDYPAIGDDHATDEEDYYNTASRAEPFLGDITPYGFSTTPGGETAELPDIDDLSPDSVDQSTLELGETRTYKRRNPFLRRIWSVLFIVAILLVILWLLYALATNMASNPSDTSTAESGIAANQQAQADDPASEYLTVLEPSDPSALITSGRGSAEIITASNTQMLRIRSIRQGKPSSKLADPILLELQPGVLRKIAGKSVTVEIRAKSGSAGTATFSVECDIAGQSECGRKRFRVGLQAEDIVFAFNVDKSTVNGNAFLAINTDVTSSADATGLGDFVDIVYTRIRISK